MRRLWMPALALLLVLTLISSCVPSCGGLDDLFEGMVTPRPTPMAPPRGITGVITMGKTGAASTIDIPASGGTMTVQDPGSPIDGLELVVPADAYDSGRQFKVSYASVVSHSFGADFNPVTPMITIDNGGAYASKIMKVDIPVKVPADSFAMGFIYDRATRTLEGMPLVAQDSDSITVGTRHFSDIVVSMIPKVKLKKDIDTSFRPGIDDWQFPNWGSYIAIGGHCAGQSLTSMWYYSVQPDGADLTLYGRYDNNDQKPATPNLWQDDSLGYRFASVIQEDEWNKFAIGFWKELSKVSEENTWNAFAYSMQLTGEPQLVVIWSKDGSGHAMVVYRIKDGNLYIADPNYPGNTDRRILYTFGEFIPYNSAANARALAAGKGKDYEITQYWAKSTVIDFSHIARRWAEFKNKTIGNDLFPRYRIVYMDEKRQYQELKDGLTLAGDKIILACEFLATRVGVNVFRDGVELQTEADGSRVLKPGNNRLGIWVRNVDSNLDPQYVDFKYFNVVSGGLLLKPPAQEGTPNQPLRFEVELSQPTPSGSRLEWYVDGKLAKSGLDFSISVSFPSEGDHKVEARLVGADGKTALQAQGTATVRQKATPTFVPGSNLPVLQKMTSVSGSFKGKWSLKKWTAASGETTADSFLTFSIPASAGSTPPPVIAWSGTSFSGKRTWGLPSYGSTEEIKGTVSADGRTLTSLVWTLTSKAEGEGSGGVGAWNSDTVWSVRFQNIPIEQLVFEKATASSFTFSKYGAEVKSYLAEASYHTVTYRLGKKESEVTAVSGSIKWDDTSMQGMPGIILTIK